MSDQLQAHLQSAIEIISPQSDQLSQASRMAALEQARTIVTLLSDPEETIVSLAYNSSSQLMCLRLGLDLSIFTLLSSSPTPLSVAALASQTAASPLLLTRVLRVLASINYVTEVGPSLYAANDISRTLLKPHIAATVRSAGDDSVQIQAQLPSYYRTSSKGYVCPEDAMDCPLQWTMDTKLHYFDWIAQDEQQANDLQVSMKAMQGGRSMWFDWFPVTEKLLQGATYGGEDAVLLVDIGAGNGTDLQAFQERFEVDGERLVLQDLGNVIDSTRDVGGGIRLMAYDFFQEQPVKGARAYYTHRVLHNWADVKAKVILEQIRTAMKQDFSRLLLNETVLPDRNCSASDAAGDINMMSILGGVKRTEAQWRNLIEAAGLKLEKIWSCAEGGDMECLIEAVRQD